MRRTLTLVPLALALVVLAACGVSHARLVREAQDSFSRGAELELQRKVGGISATAAAAPESDPAPHYALARSLAAEALSKAEGDLRADDLYATALTIRALASWRLGDADAALGAAKAVVAAAEAGEAAGTRVWPRDEGLAWALPALVKIDALADMARAMEAPGEAELRTLMDRAEAVRKDLVAAASAAALERHPLRLYLAQSGCEAALVASEALGRADDETFAALRGRYETLRSSALERLRAAASALRTEIGNGQALIQHYERLLPALDSP